MTLWKGWGAMCDREKESEIIRNEKGTPLATRAGLARFAAIIKAGPGSVLWREMEARPDQPGITKEEHDRIMVDPHWHG